MAELSQGTRLTCWVACSDLSELHKQFTEKDNRPWPENSTFAHWCQTHEDRLLNVLEEEVATSRRDHSHLSLHFDGFINRGSMADDVSVDKLSAQALLTGAEEDGPCSVTRRFCQALQTVPRGGLLATSPVEIEGAFTECSHAMALGECSSSWAEMSTAFMTLRLTHNGLWTFQDWLAAANGPSLQEPLVLVPELELHVSQESGCLCIPLVMLDGAHVSEPGERSRLVRRRCRTDLTCLCPYPQDVIPSAVALTRQ